MEVSALQQRSPALRGPTPFLRLQGDDRLVALTRRGNQSAYEVLVARYSSRLLAFCRHMLASREDAEDVLQEVFAAAFAAMVADERPINVRPWLYRIARNRSLNHLRRQTAIGVDSMDVHLADHGSSTADRVHQREEFRQLVGDVQELPETQRTALLLREIDALSYEQIAEAMETTVPAVKSLLVRARVGLAEAAEARALSCDDARLELGEVAEGLKRKSAAVRRHVKGCDRCRGFEASLGHTNRALAAMYPVGPLLLLKKFLVAQAGASSAAGAAAGAGSAGAASAGAAGAGSALTAGFAVVATKTAAVMAGAAIVTAGAVEVDHSRTVRAPHAHRAAVARVAPPAAAAVSAAPRVVATTPQPVHRSDTRATPVDAAKADAGVDVRAATTSVAGDPTGATGATGPAPLGGPAPADAAAGGALAPDEPTVVATTAQAASGTTDAVKATVAAAADTIASSPGPTPAGPATAAPVAGAGPAAAPASTPADDGTGATPGAGGDPAP